MIAEYGKDLFGLAVRRGDVPQPKASESEEGF